MSSNAVVWLLYGAAVLVMVAGIAWGKRRDSVHGYGQAQAVLGVAMVLWVAGLVVWAMSL